MHLGAGRVRDCSLLSLPEWLRAPRSALRERAEPARAGKQTATAKTRRLGLWSSGDRRWSHPGRKLARNKMVGFGLLYFFFLFVAFLGTKKKAQPFTPLHLHLSRPEAQPQWLGGRRQLSALHPPQLGLGGMVTLVGTNARALAMGSNQSTTKIRLITVLPNLAPISSQALG